MKNQKPRGGWVLLETITAVLIIGMLALVLVVALRQRDRGLAALSDARAAARAAEAALTAMQSGAVRPPAESGAAKITVDELTQPSDLSGMEWVRVKAELGGRTAELVGLVPKQVVAMSIEPGPGGRP